MSSPRREWPGAVTRPSASQRVVAGFAMSWKSAAASATARSSTGSACHAWSEAIFSQTIRVWTATSPSAWWTGSCGQPASARSHGKVASRRAQSSRGASGVGRSMGRMFMARPRVG